jgi:uncharacterized protein YlxP (DUF503 family)
MSTAELLALKARQDLLDRKLNEVLRRMGMTDAEIDDQDLDEAIDISAKTMNFTHITEILKQRIARRNGGTAA